MQDELFVYPHNVRTEFLIKIFGDRSKEGLIDSDSVKDCDARLMSLKSSWDDKEIKHSRRETPQFYCYFLANISLDTKETMLLPVRRSAGLKTTFITTIAQGV